MRFAFSAPQAPIIGCLPKSWLRAYHEDSRGLRSGPSRCLYGPRQSSDDRNGRYVLREIGCQGVDHALTRPYEIVTQTGKPVVGAVPYHILHLPGDTWPRVLLGTALRPTTSQDPTHRPGDVFVFQGIHADHLFSRRGEHLEVHHLCVRETNDNDIWAYTHANPVGQDTRSGPVRDEQRPSSQRTRRWSTSPSCGSATARSWTRPVSRWLASATTPSHRCKPAASSLAPLIRNHSLDCLPVDDQLYDCPNHLWVGLFLSQQQPSEQRKEALVRLYHGEGFIDNLEHVEPIPDDPGDVAIRESTIDLAGAGSPAPYRHLVGLTGIVAGRLSHDPTLVCRALPLPVDELVP